MFVFDSKEIQLLAINAAIHALNMDVESPTVADEPIDDAMHALLTARELLTGKKLKELPRVTDAEVQAFVEEQRVIQARGWL